MERRTTIVQPLSMCLTYLLHRDGLGRNDEEVIMYCYNQNNPEIKYKHYSMMITRTASERYDQTLVYQFDSNPMTITGVHVAAVVTGISTCELLHMLKDIERRTIDVSTGEQWNGPFTLAFFSLCFLLCVCV